MSLQENMEKTPNSSMILKIKGERSVLLDMILLYPLVGSWPWTLTLPKLRGFTLERSIEEISPSWPKAGIESSINVTLTLLVPMILWSQMLRFSLLCSKYLKPLMSRISLSKLITGNFFNALFKRLAANKRNSLLYVVQLTSLTSNLGNK